MWADDETHIDLLGFDYLVDTLEVVLTQPRLLPPTTLKSWFSSPAVWQALLLASEGTHSEGT